MSIPIQETPLLDGEDAKRFIERMKNARSRIVSKEEYEKAEEIYNRMNDKDLI
jgi:hypothetical protein